MDILTLKALAELGVGSASFVVLLYIAVIFAKFLNKFLTNHMHHIEKDVRRMADSMNKLEGGHREMGSDIKDLAQAVKEKL